MTQFINNSSGIKLAYDYLPPEKGNSVIVFLHGFRSDRTGDKVTYLWQMCQKLGLGMLRFDLSGHGESEGNFLDLTIADWLNDVSCIISRIVPTAPLVLVGSSMGGWLALLYATRIADQARIKGAVLTAAGADFPNKLMRANFSAQQNQELEATNMVTVQPAYASSPFQLRKEFFEVAKLYEVLSQPIKLAFPLYLLHGTNDTTVPVSITDEIAEATLSPQIVRYIIQDGDHRLSRPEDMRILASAVQLLVI